MLQSDCCVTWKVGLDLTNLACSATFIHGLIKDKRQRVTGIERVKLILNNILRSSVEPGLYLTTVRAQLKPYTHLSSECIIPGDLGKHVGEERIQQKQHDILKRWSLQ